MTFWCDNMCRGEPRGLLPVGQQEVTRVRGDEVIDVTEERQGLSETNQGNVFIITVVKKERTPVLFLAFSLQKEYTKKQRDQTALTSQTSIYLLHLLDLEPER